MEKFNQIGMMGGLIRMTEKIVKIEIIRLTDLINWYKVGDVIEAGYDPDQDVYIGVGRGTARRRINVQDCKEL